VPASNQLFTQTAVVVDLAIADGSVRCVFVRKWLAPTFHIHDGEARVAEMCALIFVGSKALCSAVLYGGEHRGEHPCIPRPVEPANNATYAHHPSV
jgi:hypothetical protein